MSILVPVTADILKGRKEKENGMTVSKCEEDYGIQRNVPEIHYSVKEIFKSKRKKLKRVLFDSDRAFM